jgi:hypothetical protein
VSDYVYNEEAEKLDTQLEEVLDSHRAEVDQTKAAEALPTEPPALERLVASSKEEGRKTKSAAAVLQEAHIRDRLREITSRGPDAVDRFLDGVKE